MEKRRAAARFFTVLSAVMAIGAVSFNTASSFQASGKKWVKRYDAGGYRENPNDYAYAMAVDGSGNIYVTGLSSGSSTAQDFATVKYSSAGKQLWAKRYNGPKNKSDVAEAIAVDGSGNIYVTGGSEGSGSDDDFATIKYSGAGKELWVKRYNGTGNGWDVARAIAVDHSGNIYVTGESAGSKSGKDFLTIKYSGAGKELWVIRYNGTGNKDDCAKAMAVDGSGNVYVTGRSARSGADDDFATIKYSGAGKELWVKRYKAPGASSYSASAGAHAMAVDGSGNIYVVGSNAGSGTGQDFVVVKYSGAGNQLWVKRYNGPGNGDDRANAVIVDGSGNVYVTGYSTGADFEGDFCDYATIKYSNAGAQLWVERYDGPGEWGDSDDVPNAIAVDKSGNIYVTGYSMSYDTGYDYATIKY